MIPPKIAEAAREGKWLTSIHFQAILSGDTWITLSHIGRGEMVDIRYTRWRKTSARAFRGRALMALFSNQRDLAAYLRGT